MSANENAPALSRALAFPATSIISQPQPSAAVPWDGPRLTCQIRGNVGWLGRSHADHFQEAFMAPAISAKLGPCASAAVDRTIAPQPPVVDRTTAPQPPVASPPT